MWIRPFSLRLWSPTVHNYSSNLGSKDNGYGVMQKVEETLASYLSPDSASSLKTLTLPTKPCHTTSALVGKAYMAAGRAGVRLHTLSIMKTYQANLLMDNSGKVLRTSNLLMDNRSRSFRRRSDSQPHLNSLSPAVILDLVGLLPGSNPTHQPPAPHTCSSRRRVLPLELPLPQKAWGSK